MLKVIVTTVKDSPELMGTAAEIAQELGCPCVLRQKRSLESLVQEYQQEITIIVGQRRISARFGEEEFFFHPSMALPRLINCLRGEGDRMAEAMGLRQGMSILDCTLGFATDALAASFLSGPQGRVVGLEASPIVKLLVSRGLRNYRVKSHGGLDPLKAAVLQALPEAMQRIEIVGESHNTYLRRAKDKSFDIVYFDPMFRVPREDSASMSPLRKLALPDPVNREAVVQACRVARWRVVLKESRLSSEFKRLGFKIVPGGKYSEVSFGIIEV